jgi:hypothetical protein
MLHRALILSSSFALAACAAAPDSFDPVDDEDTDAARLGAEGGTHWSLYLHGRTTYGHPDGWSYWGGPRPGVNAVPVNYDGSACIGESNPEVVAALDGHCQGGDWCYVACHSLGCAQVGYALAMFGTTASGDPRWNIAWIDGAGSAAGGSELANAGSWTQGDCVASDLRTSVVRALYDHNATAGVRAYLFAGSNGGAGSALLPGQDDGVVAYHSAGGVRTTGSYCNPGDWGCGATLPVGKSAALYAYHEVYFRDDGESFAHSATSGIASVVYDDMAAYAK